MGFIYHDAIIVTSWDSASEAHSMADQLGLHPSNICCSPINGYSTFLIPPDGSKEGWRTSDDYDIRRNEFVEWLMSQCYEDGSSHYDWLHVKYGEAESVIVRDSYGPEDPENEGGSAGWESLHMREVPLENP